MKIKASLTIIILLALTVFGTDSRFVLGAPLSVDFPIPGGHFYTQASGATDPSVGFSITNADGIPFQSTFQALGGVDQLGYPASRRFELDGFVSQATQKSILQWRPQERAVAFVNVFDLLHDRGLDPWLLATKQIPPPFDTSADTGLSFDQVRQRHLAILDISPAIRAAYLSNPNALSHYGLPMSSADLGVVVVVRAQRAAFQEWRIDTPWANAGDVTIVNAGDIAKEAGLIPAGAIVPEQAPASAPLTPEQVIANSRSAIVKVDLPGVEGSGIIFDPSGYIVTNNHVIESGGPVQITTEQGVLPAQVVGSDPLTDLAVLKVDAGTLPSLPLGDSDALMPGDEVVAIGFSPLLPDPPNEYVATVLALVGTQVPSNSHKADFIQTDAPLHPGDSGGPLLNMFGEVVGIDTALIFPTRAGQQVIASSIAINRAKPILSELITSGKVSRPSIGVTVHVLLPGLDGGQSPLVDRGLLVIGVAPGSPGERAGIQRGDVITAADGLSLNLPSDLLRVLSDHEIGDQVTLTVVKQDGTTTNIVVTLAESS